MWTSSRHLAVGDGAFADATRPAHIRALKRAFSKHLRLETLPVYIQETSPAQATASTALAPGTPSGPPHDAEQKVPSAGGAATPAREGGCSRDPSARRTPRREYLHVGLFRLHLNAARSAQPSRWTHRPVEMGLFCAVAWRIARRATVGAATPHMLALDVNRLGARPAFEARPVAEAGLIKGLDGVRHYAIVYSARLSVPGLPRSAPRIARLRRRQGYEFQVDDLSPMLRLARNGFWEA